MEFRQLRYFVQIAQDKNYTTASKKLFISQPTLSWTIKQLEDELGIKLFSPDGKKLLLTDDGEELLEHAICLLAERQKVVELFQKRKEILTGHIHLGLPLLFATGFFIQTVMNFMEHHEKVKITMDNSNSMVIQERVEAGKIDVGIVTYVFPLPTLTAIDLTNINYSVSLIVNNGHRFANKPTVSFGDLKGESLILLGEGTTDYMISAFAIQSCKKAGFTPNVLFRSREVDIICNAVANSHNISILPTPFFDPEKYPTLSAIPFNFPETKMPTAIITKKDTSKTLLVQTFTQHILEALQKAGRVKM